MPLLQSRGGSTAEGLGRKIVEEIVERVDLLSNKTISVRFAFDLAEVQQIKTTPPHSDSLDVYRLEFVY